MLVEFSPGAGSLPASRNVNPRPSRDGGQKAPGLPIPNG